jgi:hypothetical protein
MRSYIVGGIPTKIFPTIVQQKKHQLGRLEHLELQQASVQYLSCLTVVDITFFQW